MTLAQFFDMHRVANPIVVPEVDRKTPEKFEFTMIPGGRLDNLPPAFLANARRGKTKRSR